MKFTINSKEFITVLERSLLKGKYMVSGVMKSAKLSEYVQVTATDNLAVYNADNSTIVKVKYDCDIEERGEVIVEVDTLIKYLKTMGEETNFQAGDTITLQSNSKKATLPIVVVHPHMSTIYTMGKKKIEFDARLEEYLTYGSKDIPYSTALQLMSNALSDAIKACELVKSGIYTLDYHENFKISSNLNHESYTQQLDLMNSIGDPATIAISAPIHSLFNNELINIYMSDNVPITIVSPTAFLIRAPRISGD